MSLVDLQRDVQHTCVELAPSADTLARLGNDHIFTEYRHMVRRRLLGELNIAFKRTRAVVGDGFFQQAFERFMAEHPPRTRFFHQLPLEFSASALPWFETAADIPPDSADLLRFEAARREVANLPGHPSAEGETPGEFDFAHPALLNPALRLLHLRHAVHEGERPTAGYPQEPTQLVLYRPTDRDRVRYFRVNPVTFDLLSILSAQPEPMGNAVQVVAARRKLAVDERFLNGLCTVLSDFIERGVILGSRRPDP